MQGAQKEDFLGEDVAVGAEPPAFPRLLWAHPARPAAGEEGLPLPEKGAPFPSRHPRPQAGGVGGAGGCWEAFPSGGSEAPTGWGQGLRWTWNARTLGELAG